MMWKGLLWQSGIAGLYYMRNRSYDPEIGRFMSEDPIGIAGGINKYVFAGNDPINGRDPSGLVSEPPPECNDPLSFSNLCSDWWMHESAAYDENQRKQRQLNMATGDANLDNPGIRKMLESLAAGGHRHWYKLFRKEEVGGLCGKSGPGITCSRTYGTLNHIEMGGCSP